MMSSTVSIRRPLIALAVSGNGSLLEKCRPVAAPMRSSSSS
jgi:hypothetical protein